MRHFLAALAVVAAIGLAGASARADTLRFATYNVDGLPEIPGIQPDRTAEMAAIAPLLEGLAADGTPTVVALQELFDPDYYATLTDPGTVSYPVVTAKDNSNAPPPSPQAGLGDGLTLLSDLTIQSFSRVTWTDCFGTLGQSGSDCDTPKGYTFARFEIAPGVELDFYSVHADAGQDAGSIGARAAQLTQLASAILTNSIGRAVVVVGDTNSLYTRSTDVIGDFASDTGLSDAWVESALGGIVPGFGSAINSGCPPPRGNATGGAVNASGDTCELVDKILYRSSAQLLLALVDYEVPLSFVDGSDLPLSDHLPVTAVFDVQLVPEPALGGLLAGCALALLARRARASGARQGCVSDSAPPQSRT